MSEIITAQKAKSEFRVQLFASASAIALVALAFGLDQAKAEDSGPSTVWIELGGQLNRLDQDQQAFEPHLMADRPAKFAPAQEFQQLPHYSIDEFGKVVIEPRGSDWVISASISYGRTSNNNHVHQQTNPQSFVSVAGRYPVRPVAAQFADTRVRNNDTHLVLDFQAGRDVGLGIFGRHGSSVLSAGVRFAQFQSDSDVALKSDPDWHFNPKYFFGRVFAFQTYHSNVAHLSAVRSFHGVGPSLSWNASEALAGNGESDGLNVDWGLDFSVLFGRQRAKVGYEQTGFFHTQRYGTGVKNIVYHPTPVRANRSKSVISPNVGGFAGLSWRLENFKASFGYRADFFFGAMDGGIDERKSETIGLHGPFATISVGLGG